jgi:hypothetical protein
LVKRQTRKPAPINREFAEGAASLVDYGARPDRGGEVTLALALLVPAVTTRQLARHDLLRAGNQEERRGWVEGAYGELLAEQARRHEQAETVRRAADPDAAPTPVPAPPISMAHLEAAVVALLALREREIRGQEARAAQAERESLREGDDAPYACTDLGNTRRIAETYGRDLLWVPGHAFLRYDGTRWQPDSSDFVRYLAAQCARLVRAEMLALIDQRPSGEEQT